MNTERTSYDQPENPMTLTRRGRIARNVGVGAAFAAGVFAYNHFSAPSEVPLNQTVNVVPGDTVYELVNEHVEHGQSHSGEIATYVINSPENADTFKNNQLDPGEELKLPLTWDK